MKPSYMFSYRMFIQFLSVDSLYMFLNNMSSLRTHQIIVGPTAHELYPDRSS